MGGKAWILKTSPTENTLCNRKYGEALLGLAGIIVGSIIEDNITESELIVGSEDPFIRHKKYGL